MLNILLLVSVLQLGGLWVPRVPGTAVYPGEGRLPSLRGLEWKQQLQNRAHAFLQTHQVRCEFQIYLPNLETALHSPLFLHLIISKYLYYHTAALPNCRRTITPFSLPPSLQNHSDSKVTLYECEDFQGRKFEMCDDYPSLQAMGWCSKEVPSIKINSGA